MRVLSFAQNHHLPLRIFLRSGDWGDEFSANCATFVRECFVCIFVYRAYFKKNFEPIVRFIAFLQCYFKLIYKICVALCILCLITVCAYRGGGAQKLIYKNGSSFDSVANGGDFDGEFYGKFFDRFIHDNYLVSFGMRYARFCRARYYLAARDSDIAKRCLSAICLLVANVVESTRIKSSRRAVRGISLAVRQISQA